jgi:phosphoribosylaminoimidazole-succinocarboxamide synthase
MGTSISSEYQARFEKGEDQRMLDKENLRQWLIKERGFMGQGEPPEIPDEVRVELATKYVTAYEMISGEKLSLKPGDPRPRIEKNLRAGGYLHA